MIEVKFYYLLGKKEAEEGRRITLGEVARGTRLSRQTIYLWANGNQRYYQKEAIEALCKYFDCQPGDLLVYRPGDH